MKRLAIPFLLLSLIGCAPTIQPPKITTYSVNLENELRREHGCIGVGEYDGRFVDATQISFLRALRDYEKCAGKKLSIPLGIYDENNKKRGIEILVFDFSWGTGKFELVSEKELKEEFDYWSLMVDQKVPHRKVIIYKKSEHEK